MRIRVALAVLAMLSLGSPNLWAQQVLPAMGSTITGTVPVHTFTFGHANTNTSCPASTSCSVTTTSTTSGSLLVMHVAGVGNGSAQAITAASCSPSACSSGGAAFVHCSNCYFLTTSNLFVDAGYVLAAPSGVTSVSITVQNAPNAGNWVAEVDEVTYTGGGNAAFDSSGGSTLATCTSCVTSSLTISGTKDYVSRAVNVTNSATAPGAPWTSPGNITTTGIIGALNQTTVGTLTISQSPTGVVSQDVIAFK